MELKQGPNSPHTGFPGVVRKYVHCPAIVVFIYQPQGMQKEMCGRKKVIIYILLPLSKMWHVYTVHFDLFIFQCEIVISIYSQNYIFLSILLFWIDLKKCLKHIIKIQQKITNFFTSVYSQECKNEGFKWSVSQLFTMEIQKQRKSVQPTIWPCQINWPKR